MSTVYLFGAGFSKDVADGPLMRECHARMREKWQEDRRLPSDDRPDRIGLFDTAEELISELEEIGKQRFRQMRDQIVGSDLRENLEILYTFAEVVDRLGSFRFHDGADYRVLPLHNICRKDLCDLMRCVESYLGAVLSSLAVKKECKKGVFRDFLSHVDLDSDVLATFNYDLVLEKELWALGHWSPRGGYPGLTEFYPLEVQAEHINRVSRCKIIKLHGSVNWGWRLPKPSSKPRIMLFNTEEETAEELPWLFDGFGEALPEVVRGNVYRYNNRKSRFDYQLDVAPSLIKPVGSSCVLAENWRVMQNALVRADRVVTVGYSFPEQDAASRLLLLLMRDRVPLVIVHPRAGEVAGSLSGFVPHLVPQPKTFSEWVRAGCPMDR